MIDLSKLSDLLAERHGTYHTKPSLYSNAEKISGKISREIGLINDVFAEYNGEEDEDHADDMIDSVLEQRISDGIIMLVQLAVSRGIDIDSAVAKKLHRNYAEGLVLIDVDTILPPGVEVKD